MIETKVIPVLIMVGIMTDLPALDLLLPQRQRRALWLKRKGAWSGGG
jgi:hypothetical protein